MVDIQPIKNQYLTALKERQQIIDKVNEIVRDLNNLDNKINEIKSELTTIENELNNKVNKNGNETISGIKVFTDALISKNLLHSINEPVDTWTWYANHEIRDKNDSRMGEFRVVRLPLGSTRVNQADLIVTGVNGGESRISVIAEDSGTTWGTAPSPPLNATETEITTANWVLSKINEFATKNNLIGL